MPIRLLAKPSRSRVDPLPGIQFLVGRWHGAYDQTEHRIECPHRVEAPIESEDVLVEIRVEMLLADAVVGWVPKSHVLRFEKTRSLGKKHWNSGRVVGKPRGSTAEG